MSRLQTSPERQPERKPEQVSFTVHSAPDALAPEATHRTVGGRVKMLLVLLVCAAPVIASYLTYFVIRPASSSNYGSLIMPTRATPALPLFTLEGKPFLASSLKGQWLLISVGSAACEAACEQRLFMQRQLREMLGRERDRLEKIWLVNDGVTVSPSLVTALTASPVTTILRVDPGALAAWLSPEAGRALEDHFYVVDPMGEWMMRMPARPDPAKVKRDLERLLRASASWDRAGR